MGLPSTDRRAPQPALVHFSVRLDAKIVARLDALALRYRRPWRKPTRSDLLRIVILAGLVLEEKAGGDETSPSAQRPTIEARARAKRRLR